MNEILQNEFALLGITYNIELIRSRSRASEVQSARRMACKILTAHGYGRSEIGRFIHRDHANVYYLINSIGWKDAPTDTDQLHEMKRSQLTLQIRYHQNQIHKLNESLQRTLQPTLAEGIPYGC